MTTRTSKYAGRSLMLIRVGGVALLIGVLGNRVGLIGLGLAFGLFGVGFLLSAVALVMALVTLVVGRRTPEVARRAGIALVLAVAVVAIPVSTIHHITTDTEDPPQFDAVIALRGDTSNSLEYTADIAGAQRRAYPDIQPLFVQKPSGRGVRSQRAGGAGAGLGGCQRRSCGRPDRGDRHHVLVRIQG